jgi:hypothetical protein
MKPEAIQQEKESYYSGGNNVAPEPQNTSGPPQSYKISDTYQHDSGNDIKDNSAS